MKSSRWQKAVLHFLDGRVQRVYACPPPTGAVEASCTDLEGRVHQISLPKLKALFLVQTFLGDPDYKGVENVKTLTISPKSSIWNCKFSDGESVFGELEGDLEGDGGFYLHNIDPLSNNTSIFVNPVAVQKVRPINT